MELPVGYFPHLSRQIPDKKQLKGRRIYFGSRVEGMPWTKMNPFFFQLLLTGYFNSNRKVTKMGEQSAGYSSRSSIRWLVHWTTALGPKPSKASFSPLLSLPQDVLCVKCWDLLYPALETALQNKPQLCPVYLLGVRKLSKSPFQLRKSTSWLRAYTVWGPRKVCTV